MVYVRHIGDWLRVRRGRIAPKMRTLAGLILILAGAALMGSGLSWATGQASFPNDPPPPADVVGEGGGFGGEIPDPTPTPSPSPLASATPSDSTNPSSPDAPGSTQHDGAAKWPGANAVHPSTGRVPGSVGGDLDEHFYPATEGDDQGTIGNNGGTRVGSGIGNRAVSWEVRFDWDTTVMKSACSSEFMKLRGTDVTGHFPFTMLTWAGGSWTQLFGSGPGDGETPSVDLTIGPFPTQHIVMPEALLNLGHFLRAAELWALWLLGTYWIFRGIVGVIG